MTEYWKSQAKKFCEACKCWISDNKASIGFHESGKKHQFNVEKRISEIRSRGTHNDRMQMKEDNWIEQMEKAAMKDYRSKDLGHGADISARVFNQEKAERDKEKAAIEEAAAKAKEKMELQKQQQQEQEHENLAASYAAQASSNLLRKIEAPKNGTKWHKDPEVPPSSSSSSSQDDKSSDGKKSKASSGGKKWFEAVTEDGKNTYFWHIETHESCWEPPEEGFLSIKEQEKINAKHEEKEMKKIKNIYQAQTIHGNVDDAVASGSSQPSHGPGHKPSPYGAWKTVEKPIKINIGSVDLQTPTVHNTKPNPVNVPSGERSKIKFTQRSTPSLGGAFGSDSGENAFKKRKLDHRKNIRRRNQDDD